MPQPERSVAVFAEGRQRRGVVAFGSVPASVERRPQNRHGHDHQSCDPGERHELPPAEAKAGQIGFQSCHPHRHGYRKSHAGRHQQNFRIGQAQPASLAQPSHADRNANQRPASDDPHEASVAHHQKRQSGSQQKPPSQPALVYGAGRKADELPKGERRCSARTHICPDQSRPGKVAARERHGEHQPSQSPCRSDAG